MSRFFDLINLGVFEREGFEWEIGLDRGCLEFSFFYRFYEEDGLFYYVLWILWRVVKSGLLCWCFI